MISINACKKFWNDIKSLQSKLKKNIFFSNLDTESYELSDSASKIDSIPYIRAIKNTIVNSFHNITNVAIPYDRQPYLSMGWTIYKMRYGIDNRGKSNGVRIIFCINGTQLLLALISTKNECEKEKDLEEEFLNRINNFIK